MSLVSMRTTTMPRAAHLVALCSLAALLASPAEAAGPRPFFQMPVACGQTWEASTYNGHWPDQDSIDLGEWSNADTNMSQGEPVLASADGTVLDVFTSGGGDIRVYLDHGGGWVTHYIHLEQVPPLVVGQRVAQGEQIGRVGNSGTEAYHLHYSQLADGKAVRIAFNGLSIATHAGNLDSYGTWGNGEKLTSANCPMDGFVSADQDGVRYRMLYKPGTGEPKMLELSPVGFGANGVWSSQWTRSWTHFAPFQLNGQPYHIAYKSATGEVNFHRVKPGGQGVDIIGEGTWSKGWTHIMPFSLNGAPYYVAYKSTHGGANVDRINASGNGASTIWSGSWGKGWTHLVPFTMGGVQYFLAYHGGTGAMEIDRITGGGNTVSITEVYASTWSTGWSHFVPIVHENKVHLLKYKSTTGTVSFEVINANGIGTSFLGAGTWTKSWTSFSPYSINGVGHVLLYKTGTGEAKVVRLIPGGGGTDTLWSASWTKGWS